MKARDHIKAFIFALSGFAFGCITVFLAGLMTGAGHGWSSGVCCWHGIYVLPVFGVAVAYRDSSLSRILFWLVAFAMVIIDLNIWVSSQEEGWSYFHKTAKAMPSLLTIWAICWFGWQIAVIYFLCLCKRSIRTIRL